MPDAGKKRLGLMIFWSIAIAITAIACAALFYAAARGTVNERDPARADANNHFRLVLAGIEADLAAGKLGEAEALAARGELAREILRARTDKAPRVQGTLSNAQLLVGLAATAVLAFGLYGILGTPGMPALPLADRPEIQARGMDLDDAIARIETQLADNPEDVRGWSVIAPAYVELGRFDDAANAYRQIIILSGPTAELQTDLAEALLLAADGAGSDEAMDLLRAAAAADPQHARSRLYLAAENMRLASYDEAARYWQEAIGLAAEDEAWLAPARQGLAVALNNGVDTTAADQAEMIAGMVGGLSARLAADGGSVEEWSQLVRSYIVLGDLAAAQAAYDDAVAAYPAAFDRGELDTMALGAGLTLNGDAQ